jgi:hypothetical protein
MRRSWRKFLLSILINWGDAYVQRERKKEMEENQRCSTFRYYLAFTLRYQRKLWEPSNSTAGNRPRFKRGTSAHKSLASPLTIICWITRKSIKLISDGNTKGWMIGVRIPAGAGNFSLRQRVQTGSGAHLASYPMGTKGSFLGSKAAGAWSWPFTST